MNVPSAMDRLRDQPITISADPEVGFVVKQGDLASPGLDWGEMFAQIVSLTHPSVTGPRFAMRTDIEWFRLRESQDLKVADEKAQRLNTVTVEVDLNAARDFEAGLSDILCWARGYCAAQPDSSNAPLGIEALRNLNIILKRAITRTEEAKS